MEEKKDAPSKKTEAKAEPYRLRHFIDGKPAHYGRLMIAMHARAARTAARKDPKAPKVEPLTLDSVGTPEGFAKLLDAARKARL